MAGPLFLQNAASYSTLVMSVALIGHLGDPVLLSGAVLGNSIYNVTAYSLLSGLSGGMETLCGQVAPHETVTASDSLQWMLSWIAAAIVLATVGATEDTLLNLC